MREITWLGHATVLIDVGGVRLLTDPVLRRRVAYIRRAVPAAPDPGRLDGVLISHLHHDHLDRPSLRRVAGPGVAAVLPAGAARLLSSVPFGDVHEVSPGDVLEVAGARIEVVPAWHDGRRLPLPRAKVRDALGFVTEGVWFAGDTDLHEDMAALRGRVDVALVPIWGWGPSPGPGHLDPETAARAVALVQPRIAIPIHWGTFLPLVHLRRHLRLLAEPGERFAAHVGALAPDTRVEVIPPGGSLAV